MGHIHFLLLLLGQIGHCKTVYYLSLLLLLLSLVTLTFNYSGKLTQNNSRVIYGLTGRLCYTRL